MAALAFGLGAGRPGGASHKEDPPACMLGSRGQAGFTGYSLLHLSDDRLALRSQFATSKMLPFGCSVSASS